MVRKLPEHPVGKAARYRRLTPLSERAAFQKARWSNPEERAKFFAKRKGEQAKALSGALLHRGGVQMGVGLKVEEVLARGGREDESVLVRLRRMSPRARRLVYVLLDPVFERASPREIGKAARVPWSFAKRCLYYSVDFWPFVDKVRQAAFRYERHKLAGVIVQDAQVPLGEVHPAKASALVATRAQAGAIVGLTVEAPKLEVSQEISVTGELSAIRARVTKMLESAEREA